MGMLTAKEREIILQIAAMLNSAANDVPYDRIYVKDPYLIQRAVEKVLMRGLDVTEVELLLGLRSDHEFYGGPD